METLASGRVLARAQENAIDLNSVQTSPVNATAGIGGDIVGLPKSRRMYKGCTRDIQGIPKGTTRLQHRPNTVATPWQFRVSVQSANGVPSSPEPPDPAQRPAAPAGRVPTRRLGCEISGLKFRAAQCAVVKADLPHVAVEEFGQRGLVAGEPRAEQHGRWIIIEPEQRHLPTALPSTNRRNR